MATTILMHMKESPGIPHIHLKNAIDYILDVKHDGAKTDYGTFVGGNSGTDHREILNNFLDTKDLFGKRDGRQGYHFVVSFAPGETDKDTAFSVVKAFCEEYLGDAYDYVFALHTDKGHLHGHIIFNSVNRLDGYKYHYKKGDWERYIQPVTDRVCMEYGLKPLTFEEKRVGLSYAEWQQKNKGVVNKQDILKADIDYAIQQSETMEQYISTMKQMGYEMKQHYSYKEKRSFITYSMNEGDGKVFRRRDRRLGSGYRFDEIVQRVKTKDGIRTYEDILEQLNRKAEPYLRSTMLKGSRTFYRLYQAVNYYRLPNPFVVPSAQVRKDMVRLDKLLEDCRYLKEHQLPDAAALKQKRQFLQEKMEELKSERKTYYRIKDMMRSEDGELLEEYRALARQLMSVEQTHSDRFEEIEDRMEEIKSILPHDYLEAEDRVAAINQELKRIKKENGVIDHLLGTETAELRPDIILKK